MKILSDFGIKSTNKSEGSRSLLSLGIIYSDLDETKLLRPSGINDTIA